MIDRNYSTLTMKRRAKRRDWRSMAIGIALVLGIILVAIAFIFRDDAGDIPEAPESRSITAHASARLAPPIRRQTPQNSLQSGKCPIG